MEDQKVILHFFPRFLPFSWGGAENYIFDLIRYQKKQGHRVYLLSGFPDAHRPAQEDIIQFDQHKVFEYEYEGIQVLCVKPKVFDLYNYRLYRNVRQNAALFTGDWMQIFKRFFIPENISQLHVHSYERAYLYPHYLAALRTLKGGVKIYTHCHDPLPCVKHTLVDGKSQPCISKASMMQCLSCSLSWNEIPKNYNGLSYLRAKAAQLQAFFHIIEEHDRHTSAWIAYSNAMKDSLLRHGLRKKVLVVKHGVNRVFLDRPFTPKPVEKTNFAYLGRFVEAKGLHGLLAAWMTLPEQPNRKLYLAGEADEHTSPSIRSAMLDAAKRTDIVFSGKKNREEIAELLDEIHCVIIPSKFHEIGPLVFNEALARDCYVIASDLGGMREYAEEYNSRRINLFKHDDLHKLALLISEFKYEAEDCRVPVFSEEEHCRMLSELLEQVSA